MFNGIFTALITPFSNEKIDYKSLKRLIKWQIKSSVNGVVLAGSTGEGLSLTISEKKDLFAFVKEECNNNNIKILASASSSKINEVIEQVNLAENLKLDGVMITPPYYFKPTQEAIENYYSTIHKNSNIPIMIYNIPSRTGVDINNQTIIKLTELERIVALKDSSGTISRIEPILRSCKKDFAIFAGDDSLMLPAYTCGAVGLISVVSNVVPSLLVTIDKLWHQEKIKKSVKIFQILQPLVESLFIDSNPVPIKFVASLFGLSEPEVRLPLIKLSDKTKNILLEKVSSLKVVLNEQF